MKKFGFLVAVLMLASACVVWAATPGTPEYEQLKEYKKAKRAAKESGAAAASAGNRAPGFWEKEADRSGLGRMKNPAGLLQNLNPVPFFKSQKDQYEARKAAGQTK